MKVLVKKSALEQMIKRLAEDRSYHSARIDQIAGENSPVLPDAQVAMQLSTEKIPVENPDFLPVNKQQLASAASQIAGSVSPDKVQKFYRGLKKLLRKTSDLNQYKGMSETDLMEALRPMVIAEARRIDVDIPSDVSASTYITSTRDADTDDAEDPASGMTVDTGVKVGAKYEPEPEEDIEDLPKKAPAKKAKSGLERDEPMTPEEELAQRLSRSAQLPDLIRKRTVESGKKTPLESLIVGDVNRLLDAFAKAELPPPKSLAEANVDVDVISKTITEKESTLSYETRRIVFTDKLNRENLDLKPVSTTYDGEASVVVEKRKGKKPVTTVYYTLENYPFTKQQYIEIFERLLPIEVKKNHDEAVAALTKPAEEKEDVDVAKKKRKATIQKQLSIVNAQEMAYDILEKLEDFKNNKDTNSIDATFKRLKLSVTSQQFMNMSDDDKARLYPAIAKQLEEQRTSFYDISHMDYVRDILDSDEFELEYEISDDKIETTNPTSALEEKILETFFDSAFKPILDSLVKDFMNKIEEMIKLGAVNPDEKPEFQRVVDQYFSPKTYAQFLASGVEKSDWKDLVNDVTKEALTKSSIFSKTIPDFSRMYSGVKGKEGTEEYDERLAAIGMEDIGRQREPFEHIRSLVALSKAVITSAMLDHLDPEESDVLEKSMIKAEKIKSNFHKILKSASESFPAAKMIMSEPEYRNAIQKAGIPDPFELHLAPTGEVMSKLEQTGIFDKLEKASQTRALDIEGIREYIDMVSQRFIKEAAKYFSNLASPAGMSKRGNIYDFIIKYTVDVAVAAPDEDIISDTAGGIAARATKMKKDVDEAKKMAKKAESESQKMKASGKK